MTTAHRHPGRAAAHRGFTLTEVLTAIVAVVVIGAVTVAMWRSHQLGVRRRDAVETLLALQVEQDRYFGEHARYADAARLADEPPQGLGIKPVSKRGYFRISVRNSPDDLGYWATARRIDREGESPDTRCAELRIDQNGRRFAVDDEGTDRSADCWR